MRRASARVRTVKTPRALARLGRGKLFFYRRPFVGRGAGCWRGESLHRQRPQRRHRAGVNYTLHARYMRMLYGRDDDDDDGNGRLILLYFFRCAANGL